MQILIDLLLKKVPNYLLLISFIPTVCHSEAQCEEESRFCPALFRDSSLPSVAQNDKRDDLSE